MSERSSSDQLASARADAVADRWRPTRAGIRNIWEYDDQVFDFADGRLVLRGPNGSGKSNALALFAPFLLDGVMAANRMDSLGGGRSMRTLLLCLNEDERGGRFRHEQRTGYVWLELARADDHVVIGCGARASVQRDAADAWFFVTDRRPGIDLDLAPGGVPLAKGALLEQLGVGAIHDSAAAYRAAVDRALFGLGEYRYQNLIELLIVLRRPHLASKLNLDYLSVVLSDGLAALDDRLIADVAASFEDLEAVQRDLRRLQEAERTVKSFVPIYRRYLRATGHARATEAAETGRALRAARRRVAEAERGIAAADAELERVHELRGSLDDRREIAEQRQLAVIESPAYRDAQSLVEVDARRGDADSAVDKSAVRLGAAEDDATGAIAEAELAESAARGATANVDQALAAAGEAADQAGVAWSIARGEVERDDLPQVVRSFGVQRRHDIGAVRRSLADAAEAAARAAEAASAAARSAELAEASEHDRRAAAAEVDAQRRALADAVRGWIDDSGQVTDLDPVLVAVDGVGEPGSPTLRDVLAEVLGPLRDDLATREARAVDQEIALAARRVELIDERQRIADDPVPAPERLPTRPANRSNRLGAPLYACVDFTDNVPDADRAGIEAALEAAGLLDAWVGERSEDLDAWLEADPSPTGSPSLADLLVATPPIGSGLDRELVHDVLRAIPLADADITVGVDGRYALGPLTGRFLKPAAEFIGATARELRRQRLLAELDARIAAVYAELAAVGTERVLIGTERTRLDDLAASLPVDALVLAAREAMVTAIAVARTTRNAAERDEIAAGIARQLSQQTQAALVSIAGERRLPSTSEGLDESERMVHVYEQRANDLVQRVTQLATARDAHREASSRRDAVTARVSAYRLEHDDLVRVALGLAARVTELRAQLGADADAPLRQLEAIQSELRDLRADLQRADQDVSAAAERRGGVLREREVALDEVSSGQLIADEMGGRLAVLRRDDVWSVLVPGEPVPPADAGDLAGLVLAATDDVAAEPDDNALQRAYRVLLDDLGRGYDPGMSYVDHVAVVEVTSDAGTFSVLRLAVELGHQVARQQQLLTERDREIFERHLLTRVSEELRHLLNEADALVERINRSLTDRPTASGKSVRLRWEVDSADLSVRSAIGLLRKTAELLGPDEREELRRFFSTAIGQRRAEDVAASYAEILRQVLDYRSWHAFVPHIRSAGGGVQRLTRTLFRSLSGGEQAVVLHLPLFAAASAHYDIADPHAPRIIALDEAFAGIDEGMRAELMGLLVRFDLDVILTGHELWGAYEQVPALMVYDLLRHPPQEGVSAFAVRWDGATMSEA